MKRFEKLQRNRILIFIFFFTSMIGFTQNTIINSGKLEFKDFSEMIINKDNIYFFSLPDNFENEEIKIKTDTSYSRIEKIGKIQYLIKYEDFYIGKGCIVKLGVSSEHNANFFIIKLINKKRCYEKLLYLKENFKLTLIKGDFLKDNRNPQLLFLASKEGYSQYFSINFSESSPKKVVFTNYH